MAVRSSTDSVLRSIKVWRSRANTSLRFDPAKVTLVVPAPGRSLDSGSTQGNPEPGVSVHNRNHFSEAISFPLDEPQHCLRDFPPHTFPRPRSHVVPRVRRPSMHSARATHSKETVVGSLRNFANATFLASLPGKALRSCRSSPAAFNPCPVVIIQKNIFPAVPSRHHVVVRQPANFWPWTHFYRPPHLLVNMFMHTDP